MDLKNFKITNRGLYWGLIFTFGILYLCVGFVSTLHSITFFNLANNIGLAVLLGLTYEIGQASVLFSILLTKNKDRFLPWALMILLTALQVTANVYASFKFMVGTGSTDWQYWQKAILFGVQASTPEMYQVIISWISGALLPVVALGMTALVAENIKMATEEAEAKEKEAKEKELITAPANKITDIHEELEYIKKHIEDTLKPIEKPAETFEVTQPLGKYDLKFGPAFSETMNEIRKEEAEEAETKPIEAIFKKEFIEPEKPDKKKERPPKKDNVVELKKEEELLPKEEVKVPLKPKRTINPLKKKGNKPELIKHYEDINKPSKGQELIESLETLPNTTVDVPIIEEPKVVETPPEPHENQGYSSFITDNGIEVVDVKAIEKNKRRVDKWGIPIQKGEHSNFDKI